MQILDEYHLVYVGDSQVDFSPGVLSVVHDEGGYSGILTVFLLRQARTESLCVFRTWWKMEFPPC